MSITKNDAGNAVYPCRGKNAIAEGSLTALTTPVVVDVVTGLGSGTNRGNRGYIINDGAGDFTVEIAQEGVSYMTAFTLKNGENFDVTGLNISTIRLTRVSSDSSYRVNVW